MNLADYSASLKPVSLFSAFVTFTASGGAGNERRETAARKTRDDRDTSKSLVRTNRGKHIHSKDMGKRTDMDNQRVIQYRSQRTHQR